MIQSSQKITALYCRLSQEDMRQGDSDSIVNHETLLKRAREIIEKKMTK